MYIILHGVFSRLRVTQPAWERASKGPAVRGLHTVATNSSVEVTRRSGRGIRRSDERDERVRTRSAVVAYRFGGRCTITLGHSRVGLIDFERLSE